MFARAPSHLQGRRCYVPVMNSRITTLAQVAKGLGLSSFILALAVNASAAALFSKGPERFKLEASKGKTPTFRVLSDSMTKQALAMGVISMINAQPEVTPKLPMTNYVDLKFDTLTIEPVSKNSKKLEMSLKISGYTVDLDQTIDRDKFLAGQTVEVKFPASNRTVAMYDVESRGTLKMKLNPDHQSITLENVYAKMSFDSPLGDSGQEVVQFSGIGKRLP